VNKVEDFKKMIKRVHAHGMTIQGGIIFGFDEDTQDIFETTLDTVNDWGIDALEVNILTPYPGTPLYDRLSNEGRILTRDWSRYNQVDVVFQPKHMSPKELYDGAAHFAHEYYRASRIITRWLQILSIAPSYHALLPAGANYTFRRYYKRDFGVKDVGPGLSA
jgi:radical SAM superfamily enzyme YgiQ (UPF0313 family)